MRIIQSEKDDNIILIFSALPEKAAREPAIAARPASASLIRCVVSIKASRLGLIAGKVARRWCCPLPSARVEPPRSLQGNLAAKEVGPPSSRCRLKDALLTLAEVSCCQHLIKS